MAWAHGYPDGDILPIPIPLPFVQNVASIGDVFLGVGLAFFLFATVKAVESRKFSFDLRLPYAVEILEIHIQQPFRATGFAVTPPSSDIYEKKDFTYYRYDMKDQEKGKTLRFDITYGKVDAKPSVDVKFSPMSQPELMEEKRGIFLLVVGGIFLAVLASASFIRSRKGGENS